jgi:uncharacterized phiE125 gp8 family phage protein
MLSPVRTVAPAELPLTLTEVKSHLRVDHDDEDSLVAIYISAAVSYLDGWAGILGRCLVTQTWRQDFDGFCEKMRLPFPDVQSLTVAYYDTANALQTLAASNYALVNDASGARIQLASDGSFPATYDRPDAVRVTLAAGYGDASYVPYAIKAAILLHIGHLYANRDAVNTGNITSELPFAFDALVAPFRRVTV